MKFFSIFLCLLSCSLPALSQKKLIKKLLSNEKDTTRKASFLPIPAIGYSQEMGLEFGLGFIYSYYVDRKDTLNRSSNFSGTATYSTKKTYNLTLKGDAWTKGNLYHLIGELRFKKIPFNFYGVGNQTLKSNEDKLVQNQFKVLFEAEKSLLKSYYLGLSLGFENYQLADVVPGGIFNNSNFISPTGGNVFFAGASQTYDTRNSNNYTTRGFYARITYQYAPEIFKEENFSGSQIKLNVRGFTPLTNRLTLGLQGVFHSLQGRNAPFYLLSQLGNDELMRGYYSGRYRDENLLAAQAELRFRYTNRFGVVLFAGTGTVFGESGLALKNFKPNYGGGLRYFFDPAKGLSIRLDYGIGEKRQNEKRQSGFYISLAEAF